MEAKVLGVDPQVERFSLGVKQLGMDPWERVVNENPPGTRITGAIVRVLDFGVFVRVAEGVEGLIHVSQLSTERVEKPSSLYQVGDVVEGGKWSTSTFRNGRSGSASASSNDRRKGKSWRRI